MEENILKLTCKELGLTYIQTNGDLDLQNIPDLNIATHASQYNTLNTGESLTYGFHIFAFNDEFQESKPLFLKSSTTILTAFLYVRLTPNLSKPMPSTPFFKIGINFNAPPNVAANPLILPPRTKN